MEREELIERLTSEEIGGSRWQRAGMDRVYFNGLGRWFGLEADYYKSGHIASAKLDGEEISNSKARKILDRVGYGKLWYDCATGKWNSRGLELEDHRRIVANILRAVENLQEVA